MNTDKPGAPIISAPSRLASVQEFAGRVSGTEGGYAPAAWQSALPQKPGKPRLAAFLLRI